jgi:putative intracellular protease/amidase
VKAEQDFTPFAVTDGRLVTGQNPQSGGAVGDQILEVLNQ